MAVTHVGFYVEITPQFDRAGNVTGASATKVTQGYPASKHGRSVINHITLEIDDRLFGPMALEFHAQLPEPGMAQARLVSGDPEVLVTS